jgi:hypothetical protein
MPLISWLFAMIVALLATSAIVSVLPQSAADELSAASVPQSVLSADASRMGMLFASCDTDSK